MENPLRPTGIAFVSAYVDDYAAGHRFYAEVLGLEKQFDMGADKCFFKLGRDWGLYLDGGNAAVRAERKASRTTFTLAVASVWAFAAHLRAHGAEVLHDPMDMGSGDFWLQFRDPAGNLLEALGAK